MVQIFPATRSKDAPYSERTVFDAFESVTDKPNWICLYSVHQKKVVSGYEAEGDFVVLVPNLGIVVIESKGATEATLDGEEWTLEGVPDGAKHKSPFDQAERTRSNIRAQLKANDFDANSIPIARLVWFPLMASHQFAELGNKGMLFSQWELAFKTDLKKPAEIVEKCLNSFINANKNNPAMNLAPEKFDEATVAKVKEAIVTRVTSKSSIEELAEVRNSEVAKASEALDLIYDAVSENTNLFLNGLAGTGKSKILGMSAARLAAQGHKVLITCYSLMLANHYELNYGKHPNIDVYDINNLFLEVTQLKNHKSGDEWYDFELPRKAASAVSINQHLASYDAICIDEFQDLASKPEIVNAIFRFFNPNTEDPRIVIAADDWQQIFKGESYADSFSTVKEMFPDLVKVNLLNNFRQSPGLNREIYRFFDGPQDAPKSRVPKDLEWSFNVIRTTSATENKDLAETLKKLKTKFRNQDIRILSPFGEKKSQAARLFQNDPKTTDDKWLRSELKDGQGGGNISWRSIGKYKGLEDDVVIITDINQTSQDFLQDHFNTLEEMLYVGMTRARFHLVLLIADDLFPKAKSANSLL